MKSPPASIPQSVFDWAEELSIRAYPIQWFENKFINFLPAFGITIGGMFLQNRIFPHIPFAVSAFSFLLAFSGYIADVISTQALMSLKPRFIAAGSKFPVVESGLFLPKHPTLQDELFSLNNFLYLFIAASAFFLPPLGFGAVIQSACAALCNVWYRKRLLIELKFLEYWSSRELKHQTIHNLFS